MLFNFYYKIKCSIYFVWVALICHVGCLGYPKKVSGELLRIKFSMTTSRVVWVNPLKIKRLPG